MRCPNCDHIEDRVVDSRLSRGGRAIRRRRECIACEVRFTTYELIEREPLTVRKTSGAIEPYDRHKLLQSIRVACAKRPVSLAEIEGIVDGIEEALEAADNREVRSQQIGELVMSYLQGANRSRLGGYCPRSVSAPTPFCVARLKRGARCSSCIL